MTKKDWVSVQVVKPANLVQRAKIVLLACTEEVEMLFLRKRAVIVNLGFINSMQEV